MSSNTILLVEDNRDYQELIRLAFSESEIEHNLIIVPDGIVALEYLFGTGSFRDRDLNITPDLVLLDLNLPRINGLEILQRIRANPITRLLPVTIISSSLDPEDIINSYVYGCNSYIHKPVDFTILKNFVKEITYYWLTINQAPPYFGALNE
ncbi:response regulator receiver protein [Stanieria sp. NIES-3757]|nr:response regulator receiver protein [Stanieria sp. NIES-3757]